MISLKKIIFACDIHKSKWTITFYIVFQYNVTIEYDSKLSLCSHSRTTLGFLNKQDQRREDYQDVQNSTLSDDKIKQSKIYEFPKIIFQIFTKM